MYISQLCKTWLLTTSCAFLLLSGGALSHAQTADTIDYLYVSPQGNDSWSGQSPTENAGGGPFQTLTHAQEAIRALADSGLARPVEITFDAGVGSDPDFLSHWFSASPDYPVVWHSDSSRTILIYTPTAAEQNDALGAEDYANASNGRIARYYVSADGSDAWSGQSPSEDAENGPFLSLSRAQEAVDAFKAANPNAPVEVVIEGGASLTPGFLKASAGKSSHKSTAHPSATGTTHKTSSTLTPASAAKITLRGGIPPMGSSVGRTPVSSRLVFAHYMVCNRDYGGSVAGYERDIQEAQAAGIDGFVLNCGAWNDANYKLDTASMFQASHALNTGFKLFFSADVGGGSLSPAEIQNMIKVYGNDPSYFHYSGRPVLSSWGGDGSDPVATKNFWLNGVLTPLHTAGYNVFFVPQFSACSPENSTSWLLTGSQAQSSYQLWWKTYISSLGIVNGLFEVSVGSPVKDAYSRTISSPAPGQPGGLSLRNQHWECFYDPTHEFTGDDLGRTITIAGNADFIGGTYTITDVEGGYPMTDQKGNSLGNHTMIVLALPSGAPSPAKHFDATGGSYTVQSAAVTPQEGESLIAEEAYAQVAHSNGKLFISSVSPQYWRSLVNRDGRWYAEFPGGEGLAAQWNSIINTQKPEWVELFTWNDFGENTYFSPIDDVAKYWPYALPSSNNNYVGYMKSHAGFAALNKYFINWYKSGVRPAAAGDSVYFFYRTQPMNMTAANDPLGPVNSRSGSVADTIYVSAMVSSAATLQVSSGGTVQAFNIPAGSSTLRVPFRPGSQTFTLLRNGVTVLTKQGEPVVSSAPTYNFSLYSGSMSTQSLK